MINAVHAIVFTPEAEALRAFASDKLGLDGVDAGGARGVEFTGPVSDEPFGRMTAMRIPGGGEFGLYEPHHPTALGR